MLMLCKSYVKKFKQVLIKHQFCSKNRTYRKKTEKQKSSILKKENYKFKKI